jgi:hypothetical protein
MEIARGKPSYLETTSGVLSETNSTSNVHLEDRIEDRVSERSILQRSQTRLSSVISIQFPIRRFICCICFAYSIE